MLFLLVKRITPVATVIVVMLVISGITGVMMKVGVLSVTIMTAHRPPYRVVVVLFPAAAGRNTVKILIIHAVVDVEAAGGSPAILSVVP